MMIIIVVDGAYKASMEDLGLLTTKKNHIKEGIIVRNQNRKKRKSLTRQEVQVSFNFRTRFHTMK